MTSHENLTMKPPRLREPGAQVYGKEGDDISLAALQVFSCVPGYRCNGTMYAADDKILNDDENMVQNCFVSGDY
jgi:hypothetical protein